MNSFRWLTAFYFVGILGAASADAFAQGSADKASSVEADNENIESTINKAIELFKAGDYQLSIGMFQRAYEQIADPNILFNIARCYHLLGDKDNAIEYYNRFIYHPDVPEDSKLRARKYVEELNRGKTEASIEVAPLPDQAPRGAVPENETAQPTSNAADSSDIRPADASSRSRVLEWALLGSGVAALIAGGALDGIAVNKHSTFESSNELEKKKELEDQGRAFALAGDICLGVGGALTVTSIILLVVRTRKGKKHSDEHLAYAPLLTRDAAGMSWTIQF